MTIHIDKNVPIPPKRGRFAKYPWGKLKSIDDSFPETPKPGESLKRARQRVSSAAHCYGKRTGMKFTTRQMPDGTVRVWRIK